MFPLLADEHISACAWSGWSPSSRWNQTAPGTPRWGCSTRPRHISRCGSLYSRNTVPSWDHAATRSLHFMHSLSRSERWWCNVLAAAVIRLSYLLPVECQRRSNNESRRQVLLGSAFHWTSPTISLSQCWNSARPGCWGRGWNGKCRRAFILRHLSSLAPPPVRLLAPLSSRRFERVADSRPEETRRLFFRSQAGE